MKCPQFTSTLIMSSDVRLSAQLSCLLNAAGRYLPILEAPREHPPHSPEAELARKNFTLLRAFPRRVIFAGFPDQTIANNLIRTSPHNAWQKINTEHILRIEEIPEYSQRALPTLRWGRDKFGLGLLTALRQNRLITFDDSPSPPDSVPTKDGHLVICEEGEPMSEVIAANYAYAMKAGLHIIPSVDRVTSDELLEQFYSAYDAELNFPEKIDELRQTLANHLTGIEIPDHGSITFVSGGLPYGFAVENCPSTHLFKFPDLGTSIINGFATEQLNRAKPSVAVLVNPHTTPADEIVAAQSILKNRGAFVRVYEGGAANVRSIGSVLDWFPYDLLLFATHCGDADGWQETYEFTDSEQRNRKLVVDVAISAAEIPDSDKVFLTQFIRFVSLDGVSWFEPNKSGLKVGTAIDDFFAQTKARTLAPSESKRIERVVGSAALKMYDGNLLVTPSPVADEGTPIIINNACTSWQRLADNFIFANARAYIGTLHPVTPIEAAQVVTMLLEKDYHKPLPGALWSAQRRAYSGNKQRRPYLVAGVYPQHFVFSNLGLFDRIIFRLKQALNAWRRNQKLSNGLDEDIQRRVAEGVAFYEKEVRHFEQLKANGE